MLLITSQGLRLGLEPVTIRTKRAKVNALNAFNRATSLLKDLVMYLDTLPSAYLKCMGSSVPLGMREPHYIALFK